MRLVQVYTPPTPSLGDFQIAADVFTRNTAGIETISGLAFTPVLIYFQSGDGMLAWANISVAVTMTTFNFLIGITDDGTMSRRSATRCVYIRRDVGNNIQGELTGFTADGFTINFTLAGVCEARVQWVAIG